MPDMRWNVGSARHYGTGDMVLRCLYLVCLAAVACQALGEEKPEGHLTHRLELTLSADYVLSLDTEPGTLSLVPRTSDYYRLDSRTTNSGLDMSKSFSEPHNILKDLQKRFQYTIRSGNSSLTLKPDKNMFLKYELKMR